MLNWYELSYYIAKNIAGWKCHNLVVCLGGVALILQNPTYLVLDMYPIRIRVRFVCDSH
jgi:hypothetical protein